MGKGSQCSLSLFVSRSLPEEKQFWILGVTRDSIVFRPPPEGAEFCLGIDIDGKRIAKGRFLAAREGISNIEFIAADISLFEIETRFDTVICLNLLQHMKDIESVDRIFDKLIRSATGCLMVVVPITKKPDLSYEYQTRGSIPYVLLSEQYFRLKCGVTPRVLPLPVHCYGPERALVIFEKSKLFSV